MPSLFRIAIDPGMKRDDALLVLRSTMAVVGTEPMLEAFADTLIDLARIQAIARGEDSRVEA